MSWTHQPGEAEFSLNLPEDIDWQPCPASPPMMRSGRAGWGAECR